MKKNKPSSFLLGRITYTALFIILQATVLVLMFCFFRDQFAYFYAGCILLSIIVTLHIIGSESNPAYKIAWLIPILLFPIFGGLLYLLFGNVYISKQQKRLGAVLQKQADIVVNSNLQEVKLLQKNHPEAAIHSRYIQNMTLSPVSSHTQTEYFPIGEKMYEAMLRELEKAEAFIFMEYFIIEEGTMWNGILNILERKVKEGVDVRIMYDDLGCMFTLPRKYSKTLEKKGIKACVFNPFNTILSSRFNNRDHRKICVIDGNVAFTGGINLADEYINAYEKHGHWKDTGLLLRGEGVWSMTLQFLTLWDFITSQHEDFKKYAPSSKLVAAMPCDGYVQSYTDIPMNSERVGKTVYMNMINRAKHYVYMTTPYLILDNEMITALTTAAKSGIDVRIITPHIPDKKLVFSVTRSYYNQLIYAGVKIYEYTPGFIHAKTMVCDDEYAVVGTINMDYRSLYLHLECAVWMYQNHVVKDVKEDFIDTMKKSQLVSAKKLGRIKSLWRVILRVFAPLM